MPLSYAPKDEPDATGLSVMLPNLSLVQVPNPPTPCPAPDLAQTFPESVEIWGKGCVCNKNATFSLRDFARYFCLQCRTRGRSDPFRSAQCRIDKEI